MSRLIFIIIMVALVFWLIKSKRRRPPKQDEAPKVQDMVRCAHCGVHLPMSDSYLVDGKYYCSKEHSRGQAEK